MEPLTPLARAGYYLAFAAAVTPLLSTAAFNILLGAAVLTLLFAHRGLRFPPIALPLALFAAGTVLSLLLSPDPGFGLSQIKKFYVFLILPVVYTAFRRVEDGHRLVIAWSLAAGASSVWSFVEFWRKREAALQSGRDFYLAYIADRVTGFMSHWMTFSGELMIALTMLVALMLFAPWHRPRKYLWLCGGLLSAALVIALTRSVWLACGVSLLYLVGMWRPRWLPAVPLALVAGIAIAPRSIQERVTSIYKPHGTVDSNEHRHITRVAGLQMIKAHPWFGIGPQMVVRDFDRYLPDSIKRPLPAGFYGHLHNVYLQYGAERGLLTLAALLWAIGKALRDFFRSLPAASAPGKAILHGSIAVIFAVLIEGIFEVNLGDSEVLSMFLTTIACGYVAREAA
ncbi:MAG: O-antigen ligase family protein [Bryobacteraceae bacterium]